MSAFQPLLTELETSHNHHHYHWQFCFQCLPSGFTMSKEEHLPKWRIKTRQSSARPLTKWTEHLVLQMMYRIWYSEVICFGDIYTPSCLFHQLNNSFLFVCSNKVQIRDGDEFIQDVITKGISSRICCRITANAKCGLGPNHLINH